MSDVQTPTATRETEQALHSRRDILGKAAVGLAAVTGAGTLAGPALASRSTWPPVALAAPWLAA